MKWSQGYLFTLKESPADAEIPSHKLLIRGGYIRKLAQGIYTYGPLAVRSLRKLEAIVREELNRAGCLELLMPMVQPKELWEETGRWKEMGAALLKFKNRTGQEWCLGATHEEVITDFVRKDIKSYRDLPVTLYQIQTKYRDEIRPRFGLLRGREFLMKDAYSFDLDVEAAQASYERMREAYTRIFDRLGLEYRMVEADTGNIGGNQSHEFHVLAESGEDHLLVSDQGDFAANVEVCPAIDGKASSSVAAELREMEAFPTPGLRTIADLAKVTSVPENELVKTMFFDVNEKEGEPSQPIAVLLRGSDEVNSIKVKNLLGLANPPLLLDDEDVKQVTGASPGSCGPVGLEIPVYMDFGVEPLRNYIVGANRDDVHLKNVNHGRDFAPAEVADLRMAKAGDISPKGKGRLQSFRGIEVGHIFYLGTKYSKAMNATYLNTEGKSVPIEMGCYGLGVSRTLQAAVEQSHDKDGVIWPLALAPFAVHICLLDPDDSEVSAVANNLYESLASKGIDALMDDRNERPGVKFKDADLLGMPLRVTVGGRGLKDGVVEMVERKSKDMKKIPVDNIMAEIEAWIAQQ